MINYTIICILVWSTDKQTNEFLRQISYKQPTVPEDNTDKQTTVPEDNTDKQTTVPEESLQ
jgi:hypothetical protein